MANEAGIWDSIAWDARRATRELTRIYDQALIPVELNINQFGLLVYLYWAKLDGRPSQSIGALAELTGLSPSTLPRELKSLGARGWITSVADTADRRKRVISITTRGCSRLRRAIPFWRRAQTQIRDALGVDNAVALNGMLDRTSMKLKK
jgi:DNA-binding MarR family transcriptional regulator